MSIYRWLLGLVVALAFTTMAAADDNQQPLLAGNPAVAPLKWVGLLAFKNAKGETFACTAQFISPKVLLTAAHCIRDQKTGEFYDVNKMFFFLQYQNDNWSEVYKVNCASHLAGYVPKLNPNATDDEKDEAFENAMQYDFAMIQVNRESTTGHFKVDTEWLGKHPFAFQIGYPGAIENGMIIQRDFGVLALSLSRQNEIILMHANPNMTQGTSGGAWISNFSTSESPDANVVVGLTSFGIPSLPGITFGPYFRQDTYGGLFDYVSKGCPKQP
ncbi:MAG TPA: trypsin-like serine protease [Roseiarcus sp.]